MQQTLRSFNEIPVSPGLIIRSAEKEIFNRVAREEIQTPDQLENCLSVMGRLGQAVRRTPTYRTLRWLLT